jgi:translation initiation factor 3 subunit B
MSFENLPSGDEFDDDDIDFSDLREQYEVRLEEGLDAFVVLDGLPQVPEDSKAKLVKFIIRKLQPVGRVLEDGFFMPLGDDKLTAGYDEHTICGQANRIDMHSWSSIPPERLPRQ